MNYGDLTGVNSMMTKGFKPKNNFYLFKISANFICAICLLIAFLCVPSATNAATPQKTQKTQKTKLPTIIENTRDKAQNELDSIPTTQKQKSTDAQFSGILKLKDPRPQIITRDWKYFFAFKFQSLQPMGSVNNKVVGRFDLNKNPRTFHPSLEIGFSKPIITENLFVNWGLLGQTGFSSQQVQLNFPSGYAAPHDTHLNTLTSAVGAKLEWALPKLSSLYFNTSARLGRVSYTQTSLNDMAQFSEAANFLSMGLGVCYDIQDSWQVTLDYNQRKMTQKSDLRIQPENTELGFRVIW